jgi:predicted transcriptional regulator
MAKTKIREITITESKGAFSFLGRGKDEYDFSGIAALRQLLSNEKARILHEIKTEKPKSVYELAKNLGRGFKAVNDDIKILKRFGFIDLIKESTGKRDRLRPVLSIDSVTIHINI